MRFSTPALLIILLALEIIPSCSSRNENTNIANTSAANASNTAQTGPKDNIEELGMLVRLPFVPEEVAWEEKPEQKKLVEACGKPDRDGRDRGKDEQDSEDDPTAELVGSQPREYPPH